MKRPSRKSPKRKSPKRLASTVKQAKARGSARKAAGTGTAGKVGGKAPKSATPARAAAGRKAAPAKLASAAKRSGPARRGGPAKRDGTASRLTRGGGAVPREKGALPEGDRQLSDPVEAAQEDARALPEQPLFDRDDSGRDDDLAEMLGEEFVRSVTSGEEQGVELRDATVPEEEGGPFVETSGAKEFANTADDSEVEPLPTVRAPRTRLLR